VSTDKPPRVHIRGLAERAASPVHRLGPDVTVPDTLPVLLEFSRAEGPIGTATLTRDDEGIHADATLWLTGLFGKMAMKRDIGVLWPKFAIGIARTVITRDGDGTEVISAGEVVALSLCRENIDPDLPPWKVVYDG
jgi:hypothetical protein